MFDWWSELPKETRTMIALAGLGTPMGMIWFLKRYAFPEVATVWIILGVAAAIAVVGLVVVVLRTFTDESR